MSAATSFRQRLAFDEQRGELRDGDVRYLMIRSDTLMGMFRRLPAPMRRAAFTAFAESVAEYGRRSAERYRADAAEISELLDVIVATAPQLGWGQWRFDRSAPNELRLDVTNSPFAAGHGPAQEPVCAAIAGMLCALGALVFGAPATAEEISCACGGNDCCRFVARPVADPHD